MSARDAQVAPRASAPGAASPAAAAPIASRDRLLWVALEPIVARYYSEGPGRSERRDLMRVLDCGGGSGSLAVPLALAGAHVTVLDASADALATLARRAHDAGVADLVRGVQGDIEEAALVLASPGGAEASAGIDLVVAHGVLDIVADPARVVIELSEALRPGAVLSIALANPVAAVLARAVAGDVDGALRLARIEADDAARFDRAALLAACAEGGLTVEVERGIGVVADLIPGAAQQSHPQAMTALADLEAALADREPYRSIAARIHVLARKPG